MSRWALSLVVLALGLTCVARADEIAFEKDQPNVTRDEKKPREMTVAANGTFIVSEGNELVRVRLYARGPISTNPEQRNAIEAKVDKDKGTWKASLQLPNDDYEVWAEVETRDKKTKLESATRTKLISTKPQKG